MTDLTKVFNLISCLKNIKKQKLLVDLNDENHMTKNYKELGVCGISYFTFRKMVFNYSINNLKNIETSSNEVKNNIKSKWQMKI